MKAQAQAHAHAAASPHCLNCLYTLSTPRPRFCGHCGQETDLHPPSMHEFVHEYVGHYVALEGPLWRTLWALIFLPGQLTREYFAGRRRRYVLPLRIYLTASFLFFVGGHLLPHQANEPQEIGHVIQQSKQKKHKAAAPAPAPATASGASAAGTAASGADIIQLDLDRDLASCLPPGASGCGWWETQAARGLDKLKRIKGEEILARMSHSAPYAMLLMQPVFALVLLMIFAGSGRRYAEHFVFSLHMHAFWFLALLLNALTGAADLLLLGAVVHGLLAQRQVYGRGWWANLWRGLLAALLYLTALALGTAALVVVTVISS